MNIVGIDPGLTGALALFKDNQPWDVVDMPRGVVGIDGKGVYDLLYRWDAHEVYMESTHAMPKNGSKAAYSQGDSNGSIRTAVHIAAIPLVWVRSVEWQKHAGLTRVAPMTDIERKRRSRMRAIELFPAMNFKLTRAKDHNRAEALMIARYGCATSITGMVLSGT